MENILDKDMTFFEDSFAEEVWRDTYKDADDNNVNDTFRRVAKAISSVEKNEKLRKEWEENFYDMLSEFKVTPGGRIYANAGCRFKGTTLLNCFVGPKPEYDQDSLEGILYVLKTQAKTLKSEGGWGMNFSFIRPRGSFIYGIGVDSPGAVKYMELFDKSSDIITSGSGKKKSNKLGKDKIRKGAMMGLLSIWHPDIEEFITAKLQEGRLQKFNISVDCSNEFMDKVVKIKKLEKDKKEIPEDLDKWDLIFPDTTFEKYKKEWDGDIEEWKLKKYPIKVYKTVSVRELWKKIITSTYTRNDPGIIFFDIANKTHCWNYKGSKCKIKCSNPCAEQCMAFGNVCDLGSLNLTQFIDLENKCFDLNKVKKYVKYAVRFLDNVNDYTKTPLKEYDEAVKNIRRIGLGITGWGSALLMMGIRFASDKAEKIKEDLMKVFCYTAVEESIDLAEEKGMFNYCEPEKHADAYFWDQIDLPKKLRDRIRKVGIRNSALFSIQPNGNTSCVSNITTGGIEPVFLTEYNRTVIVNTIPEEIKDFCPKYWEGEFKETDLFKFTTEGTDKILKGKTKDGVVYKIDKNRGLTKEVLCEDYGVRFLKKNNLWNPKADYVVTTTELSVEDHIKDLKGWCKFLDSSVSKTINLPNNYPFEKFENVYLDAYNCGYLKGVTTYRAGTMTSVLSSTESKEENKNKIVKTTSPKRPKELPCDIHHIKVTKKLDKVRTFDYLVIVGKIEEDPYEVFVMENGFLDKKHIKGKTVKHTKGVYTVICEDGTEIKDLTKKTTEEEDMVTRLVSTSLRHGADISFVVEQLEKANGGDLYSFSRAISRSLKKYIKDGTAVKGEVCEECGGNIIRQEGCKKCSNCSWSKCG